MNRYAEAIRIISHEDVDYKKLCVEIAAQNPGAIVSAAKRLQFTVTPAWKEQCAEMMRNGHKVEAIKLYRSQARVGLKEAKIACEAMVR